MNAAQYISRRAAEHRTAVIIFLVLSALFFGSVLFLEAYAAFTCDNQNIATRAAGIVTLLAALLPAKTLYNRWEKYRNCITLKDILLASSSTTQQDTIKALLEKEIANALLK